MKVALGHWQQDIWNRLLDGQEITSPPNQLKGKAKNYISKYTRSFLNMLDRAEKASYKIVRTPGPRGGEYSATYKLDIKFQAAKAA